MSIFQKIAIDIFSKDLPNLTISTSPISPTSPTSPESAIYFWDLKYLYHHGVPEIPEAKLPETLLSPEPLPDPTPTPIDLVNLDFVNPRPEPSFSFFDDIALIDFNQEIQLIGDSSPINSFDTIG